MTQAPTPGPLSGDWPVVTDKWVETYCDLTGRDPDGGSVTFLGDGPVSTSFRDAARREIEAMLCAAPKSAIRSLAPTAPVETLGHAAAFAANIDTAPVEASGSERDLLDDAEVVLTTLCARYGYHEDNITPKDWSEWVEARRVHNAIRELRHLRPQPSGETREQCAACSRGEVTHFSTDDGFWVEITTSAGGANEHGLNGWFETLEHYPDGSTRRREYVATDSPSARPAPVALGGQHSSATDFPPDDVLACLDDTAPVRAEALDEGAAGERLAAKPLDWRKPTKRDRDEGGRDSALWIATGFGGEYAIQSDLQNFILWRIDDPYAFDTFPTVDAAKASAEADWQKTIGRKLTAHISPPPVPAQDDDKLRIAASALLDACVKDFGDPADFEGDDGSVAHSKSGGCAVTFKHMRDLNLALTAAQEGGSK